MNLMARTAIRMSALVIAGSLLVLASTRDGSAERVITIITLVVGLAVAASTIVLSRFGRQAASLLRPGRNGTPQEDQ